MTPELIDNLSKWIGNHPDVVNSPIFNDTLLVPNPERPGKKIRFYKLRLHISIHELHNYLISESSIYRLKESIDEPTEETLISDTALSAIITKNVQKFTDRYK